MRIAPVHLASSHPHNSNYSGVFGRQIGIDGMREVAGYLKSVVVPSLAASEPLRRRSGI